VTAPAASEGRECHLQQSGDLRVVATRSIERRRIPRTAGAGQPLQFAKPGCSLPWLEEEAVLRWGSALVRRSGNGGEAGAKWGLLEDKGGHNDPRDVMPKGHKSSYTDKQKRQAEHIEEGYEDRGVPKEEAEARAWATVNKSSGGGKKSGSGRGKAENKEPARKGGRNGGKTPRHPTHG
jgi:plasmid stabilization system protein ParE